jgi:transcriptional regulator with XRE-family HTH domain
MELFGRRLRARAQQLALTDAAAARRCGLSERRFGYYVRGTHEPDYTTLLKICAALDTTPDALLLPSPAAKPRSEDKLLSRLAGASRTLGLDDLQLAVDLVETLTSHRVRMAAAPTAKARRQARGRAI